MQVLRHDSDYLRGKMYGFLTVVNIQDPAVEDAFDILRGCLENLGKMLEEVVPFGIETMLGSVLTMSDCTV